jgi:RecA-family ATPase
VLDAVRGPDRDGEATLRGFDLSRDVSALAATLADIGDVRLLVIDPISAYLGAVGSHRNAEVRALLTPLSAMAAQLGVAVVAISHLNKGGGADALSRVTGSLAFVATARAA